MPRPTKCRKVCHLPVSCEFMPSGVSEASDSPVILTVDEYETIRLIDHEGFTQEECGGYMKIARTTVQEIYTGARKKLSQVLVEARPLHISGGDYRLCEGTELSCGCGGCIRHRRSKINNQGDSIMKIAVTFENGEIFQHFGHTEKFKVYQIEDGKIIGTETVDTNGSGHGALAGVLKDLSVDTLICGGIGAGAKRALDEAGIRLCAGVSGDADEAVSNLINGSLVWNCDITCDHHTEGHSGECGEHGCGEHGCGEHGCGEHGCH